MSHANVELRGGFWGPRLEVNRKATLPIQYEQCRKTKRFDAWKLNWKPGKGPKPHIFWDSDVAKWIEAASSSLATDPDPALEARAREIIDSYDDLQIERAEKDYLAAIESLERQVRPKLAASMTEETALYEDRLAVIDAQIDRCRLVLASNPGNAHIRRYLLAALQDKRQTLADALGPTE